MLEDEQKTTFNEEKLANTLPLFKSNFSWWVIFACQIDVFEDKQKTTFNEEKLSNALPLIRSTLSWWVIFARLNDVFEMS